ncbi:hypothetical protein HY085_02870 [Candidatus Gottesmanbacteria bacterium]|nr:hypothetical protein [Candidatus Gottesmanbacteria bacterium]
MKLSVFRSNKYLYGQLIDGGETLASVNKMTDPAGAGRELGQKAVKLKIKKVVFDRNGYRYHGNIKKLAEAFYEQLSTSTKGV